MSDELTKQIQLLERLLKKENNKYCADCRRKSPSWASISHGLFICIKCAGIKFKINSKVSIESWASILQKLNQLI
jgi:stromal membrane-associated protein